MADISELEGDINALAVALNRDVGDVMNNVATTLYREIVEGNPVATGFSRSNWNMNLGDPDFSVKGTRPVVKKGDETIPLPPPDVPELPKNPNLLPVSIANGVEYIQYLEEGSSQQAPSGFIAVAVEKIEGEISDLLDAVTKQSD